MRLMPRLVNRFASNRPRRWQASYARAVIVVLATCVALGGCGESPAPVVAGGDAENGRLLLRQFGCGSCHRIPGVATAFGNVGPPLESMGSRVYLAGLIANTPANMLRWIQAPQSIDPGTAMPDLQVTPEHARDMAAYLFSLR
jgi:cytochrome c